MDLKKNYLKNMKFVTLRLLNNCVPKNIFGPKRKATTKGKRKLCHDELYDLYLSQNIIWVIIMMNEMGNTCGTYGREKSCLQGFSGETCRKGLTWET